MSDDTNYPQAYVLMGPNRSRPPIFQGTVEKVRDWVLENIFPDTHMNHTVYMEENATYMSIPQFLGLTKKLSAKIGHLNNLVDFQDLVKNEEKINHPTHYNTGKIEVIDAIEDWKLGFGLGNAVKHIARADHKGNNVEDLEKAVWYLNREIQRLKGEVEEEPKKRGPRNIGSFGTGEDATLFIKSSGPNLSANQTHNLRIKIDEARKSGKYAVMIISNENDMGLYMWLTESYPYGEIWMGDQR